MAESHDPAQEPTHEEKRHDQLTSAPDATEQDAAPRIEVSEGTNGATRIDIADDAAVRPSDPTTD
ncbi:MAG: multidrug transporter [Mycetocola sp.]